MKEDAIACAGLQSQRIIIIIIIIIIIRAQGVWER
jgi:hypothetical protein